MPQLVIQEAGARALAALLVFPAVIFSCSPAVRTDGGDPNTLTVDYAGDADLLGPGYDDLPKFLVFLPLARWDNYCRTGEHVGLAERWEFSPDRRRLTIYLRRDVRWHDGVPVTARDIEFNVNLWRNPDLNWYGAWGVDSIRVLDDYTVTMFRDEPGTLSLLDWDVYYPKHLLENLDPADFFMWEFWKHPVGNGPYKYVSHDPETHIEFEANPDYYEGEPAIKHLIITLAEVPGLVRMRSGETDWGEADPLDVAPFIEDEDFNVYYGGGLAPVRIVWNVRNPLFSDKETRQALTMAIDRRALEQALGLPDDTPITDGTYSSCQFERRQIPPARPYDTMAARQILEAKGWRDTDRDGVLDQGGLPFQFLTIVSPRRERAGIFVQDQLARIGVRMEIQMLDYGATAKRFNEGDFAAIIPRLPHLDLKFGEPVSPNGYRNARVQELVTGIQEAFDLDELERMYGELSEIYYDEIPGTFLYPRLRAQVARSWLRGIDASMAGFPRVERLWIERED